MLLRILFVLILLGGTLGAQANAEVGEEQHPGTECNLALDPGGNNKFFQMQILPNGTEAICHIRIPDNFNANDIWIATMKGTGPAFGFNEGTMHLCFYYENIWVKCGLPNDVINLWVAPPPDMPEGPGLGKVGAYILVNIPSNKTGYILQYQAIFINNN